MAHCCFRVCLHHNKQYKKENVVNNIAVISRDSYQTDMVESQDSRTVILSDGRVTEVSFRTKQPLWILFIAQFTLSYLPAPIAQLVECPLRGTGGHGFDPGPRHTKVVKNGTSCSSLGTQIYGEELGLVDPVSG